MKLIYDVEDKPKLGALITYGFQQVLAIMAATIAVPMIVGNGMSTGAAIFGAGCGTLVYTFFTKRKSPVFLGSSFAFIGSMVAAFAGAVSVQAGFAGLLLGAIFAGLVYVIIAAITKAVGVGWIDRLMPAVVIGPTVSIIGLSLAGNAISDLQVSSATGETTKIAVLCGLVALFATMLASTYGRKHARMIPFIIGILSGYVLAAIFTFIGIATGNTALQITNFSALTSLFADGVQLSSFFSVPDFTFTHAFAGFSEITGAYVGTIFAAYVPVAFVVFAEHIADHKNISSIIGRDLLKDPGLDHTLLGDGIGSIVGAFFGGCPNTTYGESIGCVAITRNASVATIITAAIECICLSFLSPVVGFIATINQKLEQAIRHMLGAFLAIVCEGKPYVDWLSWGKDIGVQDLSVDLYVIKFTLGLMVHATISQIVTILAALIAFAKVGKNI